MNLKQKTRMKKRLLNTLLIMVSCLTSQAQTLAFGPLHSADSPREDWLLPGDTITQSGQRMIYQGKPMKNVKYSIAPSSLSQLQSETATDGKHGWQDGKKVLGESYRPKTVSDLNYGLAPTYSYGLHPGLNVSLSASAFATFGKNLPHKGGFSQNINATYLAPLTKDGKLWIAAGGYLDNTFWGSDSYRDVGLYAIMGYKFNDHWEAYVYGQLSVSNNYDTLYGQYAGYGPYGYERYGIGSYPGMWGMGGTMPFGYGMGMPGANVLGAGVRYNVNKNFSIGISVEGVWYNNKGTDYFDRYNYPNPNPKK